jgi:hypothetical protein
MACGGGQRETGHAAAKPQHAWNFRPRHSFARPCFAPLAAARLCYDAMHVTQMHAKQARVKQAA